MDEIKYWKVIACFGEKEAARVWQDAKWRVMFPEVIQRLESKEDRLRYDTMIPSILQKAIAACEPPRYVFAFRENKLICVNSLEYVPFDFTILSPLEALERFGGDLMTEAVDYGSVEK